MLTLEAGPLPQLLHAGLTAADIPAVLIDTRRVKAALKEMTVKTDRNDARGSWLSERVEKCFGRP